MFCSIAIAFKKILLSKNNAVVHSTRKCNAQPELLCRTKYSNKDLPDSRVKYEQYVQYLKLCYLKKVLLTTMLF